MITIGRIGSALQRFFEATAKARVNSVLLGMDRERLAAMGYSYELLKQGPAAWPWRESNQDGAARAAEAKRSDAMPPASGEASRAENLPLRGKRAANPHGPGFDAGRDAA